ncbi:MAG: gamma-butyrobetaine dioxygenase [Rhodospirillales bacterium]|nr:gamma-butyrobetaine dioxygenase [Rhodospirillales bacterium]
MKRNSVEISPDKTYLTLRWADGNQARFHAIWLRDNGLDGDTRSPLNGQRLITLGDIPHDTRILEASVRETGDLQVLFGPENKQIAFPEDWLRRHVYDREPASEADPGPISFWNAGLQDRYPRSSWELIRHAPAELGRWLAGVRAYGFAVVGGVPCQSGAVCEVAELFGYVRETNYGRWFDVRAEVNPSNLAYTNLGLQAHTDNPYRDPVPTLQLLCCLENAVDGGDSVVVDGFNAARRLRSEDPGAFDLLARYPASFEYTGARGVHLRADKPMIELAADGGISTIRFNNRSTAPLVNIPFDEMQAYYRAYRLFADIIDDQTMQVSFRLSPGELFIVDNRRVLHARKPFSGTGQRWLQGCYADVDGLLSTLSVIEQQQKTGVMA